MKRFIFCLIMGLGLFGTSLSFQSCKEEFQPKTSTSINQGIAESRGGATYGVTVFSTGNPSLLVEMDPQGNVTSATTAFINNSSGQPIPIEDLKGVCIENGRILVTTGYHPVDAYSHMLAEVVDQYTGELNLISHSTIGAVSDIDYDQASGNLYGLANNANQLVRIDNNNNNFDLYQVVGNITNLGTNYVAKGLSFTGPQDNPQIVVAATRNALGNAQLYDVSFFAGPAIIRTVINPANQLATAHCGIGYSVTLNQVLINRRAAAGFGLNGFNWILPLANPTASSFWGGTGFNFEDLTTER